MSPDAKAASDTIIPVTLLKSNDRCQILSSKKVATKIDTVLTNPTTTVASSFLLEEVIPAFSKILGLYKTTESIPEHCWKKWIPTHTIKTREGVMAISSGNPRMSQASSPGLN